MADHLFGITDTGKVRENNEDVFIAEEVMKGQFTIAGVIDGVGGYEGGEIAAALTREVVLNELTLVGGDIITQLILAFNLANEEIVARKLEDQQLVNMACVATIAVIDRQNNQFHYIHVGDTRLYLFRDNSLIKISHDQSFVGFLEDSGRITEEEAMQHPKRNQINQALGLESLEEKSDNYFETGSSPFLPGDILLLCSDGLTDLVDKKSITAALAADSKLKVKAGKLVDEANKAGGKDNVTVVLARNDKTPVKHEISPPVADLFTPVPVPETNDLKPQVQQELKPDTGTINETIPVLNKGNDADPVIKITHNHKGLIILLSALCLLFLTAALWLFFTSPPVKLKGSGQLNAVHPTPLNPYLNPQEKMISDTLSRLKGDTLILSGKLVKSPVRLSRALSINRDTLIIKTSGDIVFQRDPAYKGPALILSAACKYIVIDRLVLENFETGIVSYKNVMDLKNVRFDGVKTPLQVLFEFPDHSFVNGRVSKRAYQADSLAKK
ncbi:MAG TPA: protein phosphatase 2C domain-containing protein [Pedobacter sp.]